MATIDTKVISGFDEMTVEQKLDALLKTEIPEAVDLTKYVLKDTFDKKASEAASLSKQLKERMSDEELKSAESAKALEEMKTELENLRKEKTVSEYTAKYIALGYDKELATETAKAMQEGNMAKVFENGEKHRQAMEKKIKEELLNGTPKPGGSHGGNGKTDDEKFAVKKAKELAKSRHGNDKSYNEIMSKYKGK